MASTAPAPVLTGYEPVDRFYATRSTQGGRIVYSLDVSPLTIASGLLPRPDPDRPTEGNRQVRLAHAQSFARYFRENENWVSPALMLRASDVFSFEPKDRVEGVQFGLLEIAKADRGELLILDGQHRILGFYLAYEATIRERQKTRELMQAAERNGDPPAVMAHFKAQLDRVNKELHRMQAEHIALQVHITNDPRLYKQMFVDVADNALGIKKSIQAGFDSRKVVHRALPIIVQHPLLQGRVDEQQDTISRNSEHLLGLKHVADIVRTLAVGLRGRISAERERQYNEQQLADLTTPFLDALVTAFEDFNDLVSGEMTPRELRERSLIGSATMLRALAGAWYELRESYNYTNQQATEFFAAIQSVMTTPLKPESSPWLAEERLESDFYQGAKGYTSPNAHRGVDMDLTAALVKWARTRPSWLGKTLPTPTAAATDPDGAESRLDPDLKSSAPRSDSRPLASVTA